MKLDLVGGGASFVAGHGVGSEYFGLFVVSLLGNGAMLWLGSELHLIPGFFGCGNAAASRFGLEMRPSLWLGCLGNAAECSSGSEMRPPLGWSHFGNAARL